MFEDTVGKSTHKVWLRYNNSKFEKPYLIPIGGIRGDIISLAKSETGEVNIHKAYRIPEGLDKNTYLETTLEDINGLTKAHCIKINQLKEKDDFLETDITLNEPRCSYYLRSKTDLVNNEKQRKNIGSYNKCPAISPTKTYQCRIVLEYNQVFLRWERYAKHWLYGFKNNDNSSRYKLVKTLIVSPDECYNAKELRDQGIEFQPKRLKELLTKSFMRKTLREKFMLSSGSDNIGIKKTAYIKGEDLIRIIREQLNYSTHEEARHRLQKIKNNS